MYKEHWEKILEAWRNKLEASLDLSNAMQIHLVAEEKGKGEMHCFISIDDDRPNAEFVVTRMLRRLVDLKLAGHDPIKVQLSAVKWVNRATVLDESGHIHDEKERLESRNISVAP
jgi:hypothetical protein